MTQNKIVDIDNGYNMLIHNLKKELAGSVDIGVFGEKDSDMVIIASANEFGATITSKKSRTWLYYALKRKGINLNYNKFMSKNTVIPERSFLRSTFDENKNNIYNFIEKVIYKFADKKISKNTLWNPIGIYTRSLVRQKISNSRSWAKPKTRFTIALEGDGFTTPLIHTGRLRDSIDFRVN